MLVSCRSSNKIDGHMHLSIQTTFALSYLNSLSTHSVTERLEEPVLLFMSGSQDRAGLEQRLRRISQHTTD